MGELDGIAATYVPLTERAGVRSPKLALAVRQCTKANSQFPNGLVVSSDDEVRGRLAESLRQCGLEPVSADTVAASRIALAVHEIWIVLCIEFLNDGNYGDVVKLMVMSQRRIPVIVFSRTGDWPEYLRAVGGGAFDYLAYPPMSGDLQRVILNALLRNKPNIEGVEVA